MKQRVMNWGLTLIAAGVYVAAAVADDPIAEDTVEKMRQAMPAAARVQPGKPRRLLVFNLCRGFKHGSIPYASRAFEILGETTGAFTATPSDDIAVFEWETLQQFDTVLMNNTTGDLFAPVGLDKLSQEEQEKARLREQRLKESLLRFVREGGGLVGVHAATDSCYKWADYGDLIGAYFSGHPWSEDVTVKLDDPGHPLCPAFKGRSFRVGDEIYQFREPYSRAKLRVLLSLDAKGTNMNKGDKIRRTDGDFAVSWIQTYGQGRVFYCSLGHRNEIFWNPTVMQFYLDGIQFALGDLQVDTTPSAKLSEKYLERSRRDGREAGLDAIFAEMAGHSIDGDTADAKRIADLVIEAQKSGSRKERTGLVERLAALLREDTSSDCKRFACRQLYLIGTKEAVPALTPLLLDAELSDMARYALERMPDREAGAALIAALPDADGLIEAGIINSIGERGGRAATAALVQRLADTDEQVAAATATALGKIGSKAAADALLEARTNAATTLVPAVDNALLECAARLNARRGVPLLSGKGVARRVYEALYTADTADHVKASAYHGLALLDGKDAVPETLSILKQMPSAALTETAAQLVRKLPGKGVAATFADELANMPARAQVLTIAALAARGERSALTPVLQLCTTEQAEVRLAAIRALQRIGDAGVVPVLARIAANAEADETERDAARRSLYRLNSVAVDEMIETSLADVPEGMRVELIRALGERKATETVPALLHTARDADSDVRKESLEALGELAQTDDLPALTQLLVQTEKSSERSELERIIVAVSQQLDPARRPPECVLSTLAADLPAGVRCSLLAVLGKISAPGGLDALYAALSHDDDEVQKTAIRALADWPDATPMERLRDLSRTSDSLIHRVLALRGYARQLAMASDRPMKQTLSMYKEAFAIAQGDQEKKSLLSGLGELHHPDALALAESYVSDKAVQSEALMAATKIMQALDGAAMKLSASHGKGAEKKAVDGTRDTRWTTGGKMVGGEWFQIDLGYETDIKELWLDAGPVGTDYPRGYEIYISTDGENWGQPVVTGAGKEKIFTIEIPPTYGRFIKIVQTGSSGGNFWSICELRVNGCPRILDEAKATLDKANWKASSSVRSEDAPLAIDGDLEKRWHTGRKMQRGDWFMIDIGEEKTIRRVVLNAAKSGSDYPRAYEVHVSTDGETWLGPIGMGAGSKALTVIPVLPRRGRYVKVVQTGESDHWYWSIYDLKILAE